MRPSSRLLLAPLLVLATAAHASHVSAWIVSRDPAALESLRLYAPHLDEANPAWYSLGVEGTILRKPGAEDDAWRAAMSGMTLIPTIANTDQGKFTVEETEALLADPERWNAHVEDLVQLVLVNAYDGIEIDYEWLTAGARENLVAFLSDLADALHAQRKVLSVTLHPKTHDTTRDGPGSQDWERIGRIADRVKIMVYDYHWATSAAGPIAPPEWITNVVQYAKTTLPAEKAIVGLPWYGYDWRGMEGEPVFYRDALRKLEDTGAELTRDSSGEATFRYGDRVVFFQDAAAFRAKVDLVRSVWPGVAGFAHWRPGGEDPAKWNVVAELNQGGGFGDERKRRRPVRPTIGGSTDERRLLADVAPRRGALAAVFVLLVLAGVWWFGRRA